MADGDMSGQARDGLLFEYLTDEAHIDVPVELRAVASEDASAFLPAMLQGEQGKVRKPGHILARRIDAEDAARLMGAVWLVIQQRIQGIIVNRSAICAIRVISQHVVSHHQLPARLAAPIGAPAGRAGVPAHTSLLVVHWL